MRARARATTFVFITLTSSLTVIQVIKDYQLFMVVGILLAVDLTIMTTWQVSDPFYRAIKQMEPYVSTKKIYNLHFYFIKRLCTVIYQKFSKRSIICELLLDCSITLPARI